MLVESLVGVHQQQTQRSCDNHGLEVAQYLVEGLQEQIQPVLMGLGRYFASSMALERLHCFCEWELYSRAATQPSVFAEGRFQIQHLNLSGLLNRI